MQIEKINCQEKKDCKINIFLNWICVKRKKEKKKQVK